jgi:hypothetical protein
MIILKYRFIEGGGKTSKYMTLAGAQKAAWRQIGRFPSIGSSYAVDDYGVCTLRVEGCSLAELFPRA